jgi:nucleoside-diphosphate-sugar epimerase
MERVVGRWEQQRGGYLPRPICIEGDLTLPGLALDREARRWIRQRCDRILHNAASLTFDGADRAREPWLSNLTGAEHVLELCRETGVRELHYMSTAYVCGRRPGPVYEAELACGQEFRNDYEQSKFEAEQVVRSAPFLDSLTVYRPAVIVGDSKTGYTSSYHALYQYLQLVFMLDRFLDTPRDANGCRHVELRLNATGQERRNLVPVDWVSAVTTCLFGDAKCHGQTYHLTPAAPISVQQIEEACERYFHFSGVTFEGPGRPTKEDRNDLEKLFYDQLDTYSSYWDSEPIFDCTNTSRMVPQLPCPTIDEQVIRRLIDYAIEDRWGNRRNDKPERPVDIARMLDDLPRSRNGQPAADFQLGLDIWGPGGGQWHVGASGGGLFSAEPGLAPECDVVLRTDAVTFAAIIQAEVTTRHAVRQGLVEVVSKNDRPPDPAALLALFVKGRRQPSQTQPQSPQPA